MNTPTRTTQNQVREVNTSHTLHSLHSYARDIHSHYIRESDA